MISYSKSGLSALTAPVTALFYVFAILSGSTAYAQNFYDPYASQGTSGGAGGSTTNLGNGSGVFNGGSGLSGYSAGGNGNGSGQLGVGQQQQQGGLLSSGTGQQDFSPTALPDYSSLGLENGQVQQGSLTPITRPTDSANPGPLFARPSLINPNQFELFQRPVPKLSEFETFVSETLGKPLPRFGSSLILTRNRGFATPPTTTVPPDYRLNPGDELLVSVTGSVEAKLRLTIDNEGRIFVPRVGSINLAGMRYGDLSEALSRRFAEQFKQARVSVVVGRLHGITVYVTGFATEPGAYSVTSLSTMIDAVLAAGGPSAGGSFRSVNLRRGGRLVASLDLYDLLLRGDTSRDAVLQNNDVLNIDPAGPEIAVSGSVNQAAIFEAKPGESLGDMVRDAGGLDSLADDSRLVVRRLGDLDNGGTRQLTFPEADRFAAERATVVSVLSFGHIARPLERQSVLVTIDGEVDRPGRYFLGPQSSIGDLVAKAGGLTSGAYVFGTRLERESVRLQEKDSYDKALDNLELSALAAPIAALSTANPGAGQTRSQAALSIIAKLRDQKPDGRVVLSLPYLAAALPGDLVIENNDRIFVPPRPRTIGVFGAVYQSGAFLYSSANARIGDYLKLAGGPQKIADRGDVFVVRANGAVISSRATRNFLGQYALPGDVIFVPVRTSPSFFDRLVAIAGVVSQFGVTALTIKAVS